MEKKAGSVIYKIVIALAAAVFLFAAFKLFTAGFQYFLAAKEYRGIASDAGMDDVNKGDTPEEELTLEDVGTVDFEELLKVNPDTVGWIRFPNPDTINYPIVHSKDNAEYLYRTFNGKDNGSGTIFMDMGCSDKFGDYNTLIYGHNMNDGSMFAKLMKYEDEEYFKKNPYFYIYTLNGTVYRLKVMSVMKTDDKSEAYTRDFASDTAFKTFVKKMLSNSIYDTGVEAEDVEKMVTLSTCTNRASNERWLVQGAVVNTIYGE